MASRRTAQSRPPLKRVYINGRFLSQKLTGVQRFALQALTALDQLQAKQPGRLDFVLIAPQGVSAPALRAIDFWNYGALSGHPWEQLTLPRVIQKDWLLGFGPTGPLSKRRQVVTIHDAAVYAVPQSYSFKFRLLYKALLPALVRTTPAVMTVSEFSRGELVRRIGAKESKVHLCGEGWEHIRELTQAPSTLERFGLHSRKYILAVSSITPHKNFQVVARALEHLSNDSTQVVVVGAQDPSVFRAAGTKNLERLKLLGFVQDDELRTLYEGAAAFVHPSRYEGFGLPPLEAMALGCPVLASRTGALPEVCGQAALYFDPDDPRELARLMDRVIRSEEERKRLIALGTRQLKHHSWASCAHRYRSLMDRLVEEGDHPAARKRSP